MSQPIFQHFLQEKDKEKQQRKLDKADVTLEYYNRIAEMLECGGYIKNESFLFSVQQFIEKNEYISDKQMEVLDRIYDHPDDGYDDGRDPF